MIDADAEPIGHIAPIKLIRLDGKPLRVTDLDIANGARVPDPALYRRSELCQSWYLKDEG